LGNLLALSENTALKYMPRTNALAYFGEILVIGRFCNNG